MDEAEIRRRFQHHRPIGAVATAHNEVREDFATFASQVLNGLPEGREKALAFTALEEASFWAHAAIARASAL
jgi:hypothetical protein